MYVIQKDGLYLMGIYPMGIKEFMPNGKLEDVGTCIWGNDITAAKSFEHISSAKQYAKKHGGEVIFIRTKEDNDDIQQKDR